MEKEYQEIFKADAQEIPAIQVELNQLNIDYRIIIEKRQNNDPTTEITVWNKEGGEKSIMSAWRKEGGGWLISYSSKK